MYKRKPKNKVAIRLGQINIHDTLLNEQIVMAINELCIYHNQHKTAAARYLMFLGAKAYKNLNLLRTLRGFEVPNLPGYHQLLRAELKAKAGTHKIRPIVKAQTLKKSIPKGFEGHEYLAKDPELRYDIITNMWDYITQLYKGDAKEGVQWCEDKFTFALTYKGDLDLFPPKAWIELYQYYSLKLKAKVSNDEVEQGTNMFNHTNTKVDWEALNIEEQQEKKK